MICVAWAGLRSAGRWRWAGVVTFAVYAYAPLADVAAVELRNPEPFQDVVTGGRLPSPPVGGAVTRLALQREFPSSREFPLHIDWADLRGFD